MYLYSCGLFHSSLWGASNLCRRASADYLKMFLKSISCVQMWELDHKEGWALKNQCYRTVVLKKAPESPLDSKEIKPVHPKGNQSWIFVGRTDAEAEALLLWPPDVKSWCIGKDPDAGKEWGQEEKRVTEWDDWMASSNQWTWVWATDSKR